MQKRSQFTVEFVIIFSVAFFFFLVLLTMIDHFIANNREEAELKKMNALGESIRKNLALADETGTGFEIQMRIPEDLDGQQYEIFIDEDVNLLYLRHAETNTMVPKAIPDTSVTDPNGIISKGCNKITKENGKIFIRPC